MPTVGAVGGSQMVEDHGSGYRGWGTAAGSNRQPSTGLSASNTHGQLSDTGSQPGGFSNTTTAFGGSDAHDSAMYKDGSSSDGIAALGVGPAAGQRNNDMRRGPSNASSSYSAGHASEMEDPYASESPPPVPSHGYDSGHQYTAYQPGPYGDSGDTGGIGMPMVQDVSARRNTRIEQGGGYQTGNSGIAQNF